MLQTPSHLPPGWLVDLGTSSVWSGQRMRFFFAPLSVGVFLPRAGAFGSSALSFLLAFGKCVGYCVGLPPPQPPSP